MHASTEAICKLYTRLHAWIAMVFCKNRTEVGRKLFKWHSNGMEIVGIAPLNAA